SDVRKPADAARYRAEQEAEAKRVSSIAAAQASSESARLSGEGERARRSALADATRLEGEAVASATLATGSAEAEAMSKKADAYREYSQAAVLQMVVDTLPLVARELAAPMAAIDKLTVISSDGAGALPKAVVSNFTQVQQLVKDVSGVDLAGLMGSFLSGSGPAPRSGAPRPELAPPAADDEPGTDPRT
ncbi:MAG: flotillin family protein, partial [Actinomycetota bacterium]|nr:flotillin family protein [Actinomycetota bacterium]